ncbi:MAG: biosynthetic-type acetolactate synthase large subunit [Puniceicoccales bacterium]|jgi:acetolactate synthase-1/2/3 large subunit|nr:biosynthetic-type acetolactate synthase large subunit [Puniceicoccales bacterium]
MAKSKKNSVPSQAETKVHAPSPSGVTAPMRGADVVVRCLELLGVDTVFAYPGGSLLEISQALTRTKKIRSILPRHEQGGGFMAQGYARATGKPGVCLATSGPGSTNLVTPIADAFMDSIPLVAITGQVFQQFIGKNAFQEADFFGITLPIVKHSILVLDPAELPSAIFKAFKIATTGRPGPVVVDIPKDVQQAVFTPHFPASFDEVDVPGLALPSRADDAVLQQILQMLAEAKRPVLYIGGGIISSDAAAAAREFALFTGIPVASTLMGLGVLSPEHPQSLYWFGMHGTVAGNWAVYQSDLLIAAGVRFDDRVTGSVDKFAPNARIVHIDIDRSEHNKNITVQLPVEADIKDVLERLRVLAKKTFFKKPDLSAWMATINEWKKQYPFPFAYDAGRTQHILPQQAIQALYEESKGGAIITTGVGQHQMWTPQFYHFSTPRTFISSMGAGTMGFGLPAAIGAKIACPGATVVDIDGDGSFLMNIQELACLAVEKIPVKIFLINNQHLGMVTQWEDRFYDGVRGQTILGDPKNIGGPENVNALYPDFVKIAAGFGISGKRVLHRENLREAIREMLSHDGPYLLDIVVPHSEHVLPFIPQKKSAMEILTR